MERGNETTSRPAAPGDKKYPGSLPGSLGKGRPKQRAGGRKNRAAGERLEGHPAAAETNRDCARPGDTGRSTAVSAYPGDVIMAAHRPELEKMCQIIHICGEAHFANLQSRVNDSQRYKLFSFLQEELKDAYAIADIVVTRAGAQVLNEIAYYGTPSIIVPMHAYSSGHQLENAKRFGAHNASIMIDENILTPAKLVVQIHQLLANQETLLQMRSRAKELYIPNAATHILDEIMTLNT